ncbi:sigma-70 family RNA polymerase sigma factor [Niabella defluvii]|nr:sigma-70 family RNA polymerase sigma factor [Niabella sp. I65]
MSTWLYKVCLYTALNNTKQKNLAVKHALNLQNEAQAIQEYDHTIDQKIAQLYHAIGFLTDVEKAIIILYLEQRPYKEMENILGLSENVLRVRVARIKDKLKKSCEMEKDELKEIWSQQTIGTFGVGDMKIRYFGKIAGTAYGSAKAIKRKLLLFIVSGCCFCPFYY